MNRIQDSRFIGHDSFYSENPEAWPFRACFVAPFEGLQFLDSGKVSGKRQNMMRDEWIKWNARVSCVSPGTVKDGVLKIGTVSSPVYNPSDKIKVPDVLFYENPQVIAHSSSK